MFAIPLIKAKVKDDAFSFNIKYCSVGINIDIMASVNIHTNNVIFDVPPSFYEDVISKPKLIDIFEGLMPHVQLRCVNKNCNMNYYSCSDNLKCVCPSWHTGYLDWSNIKIEPFFEYYESCNVDKFWVQNDIIYGVTRIISTANSQLNPIVIAPIDFNAFDKDKLKNRIMTIVTFS